MDFGHASDGKALDEQVLAERGSRNQKSRPRIGWRTGHDGLKSNVPPGGFVYIPPDFGG
jgi:hypothetical protein